MHLKLYPSVIFNILTAACTEVAKCLRRVPYFFVVYSKAMYLACGNTFTTCIV